jgi:hypothetical protein
MELLMRNHTATLVELDTPVLKHICTSLQAGLKSHEVAISSQCAAALEHLAAFHFNATSDDRDSAVKVSKRWHKDDKKNENTPPCSGLGCQGEQTWNRYKKKKKHSNWTKLRSENKTPHLG